MPRVFLSALIWSFYDKQFLIGLKSFHNFHLAGFNFFYTYFLLEIYYLREDHFEYKVPFLLAIWATFITFLLFSLFFPFWDPGLWLLFLSEVSIEIVHLYCHYYISPFVHFKDQNLFLILFCRPLAKSVLLFYVADNYLLFFQTQKFR